MKDGQVFEFFVLIFIVYLERKIYGALHGEKARHFHAIIGWKALVDSIEEFGKDSPLTALVPK